MPTAIRVVDQFIELSDTPASFSGQGSKFVAVNSGATALEFVAAPSGGTPGGSTTQVQYNNAGAFGGAAGFIYNLAASPNVSITAQNAAYTPLLVKGAASQSVDLVQVQKSDGTVYAGFDNIGRVYANLGTGVTNFFAAGAGNSTTTGTAQVGIGSNALASVTSAAGNVALGYYALSSLTTSGGNFGLGSNAGRFITGGANVIIGDTAGYGVSGQSTAQRIIAIGSNALKSITTGSYSVSIGYAAGFSATTASSCIYLGYYAGYRQTTLSNILIIDNQLRADAATETTNAILYGVMAAAPANQDLTVNANLFLSQVKSGATQVAAGAAANEVWKTASHASLPDNVLMIGV